MLHAFGHTVVEGDCGMVGLNLVKNALTAEAYGAAGVGYDLILISHVIKGMSGPQTAHHMREVGYQGLILGLISHTSHEHDFQVFKDSGADGILCKPLKISAFNDVLTGGSPVSKHPYLCCRHTYSAYEHKQTFAFLSSGVQLLNRLH